VKHESHGWGLDRGLERPTYPAAKDRDVVEELVTQGAHRAARNPATRQGKPLSSKEFTQKMDVTFQTFQASTSAPINPHLSEVATHSHTEPQLPHAGDMQGFLSFLAVNRPSPRTAVRTRQGHASA
jgi:hypothetical protein